MTLIASAILLLIGTYASPTDKPAGGIYRVTFDTATGQFTHPKLLAASAKPTFLALHPNGRILYATTDLQGFEGAEDRAPNSFIISPDKKTLRPLQHQIEGNLPLVHAVVDPTGQSLYAVSYRSNTIESFALGLDGNPGPASMIRNQGVLGPRTDRQDSSHPHNVTQSPDGRHLYVCDLGLDRIYCYRPDPETARLAPVDPPFTQTPPGMGPRHAAFSVDGRFLYVIGELDNSIAVYACVPSSGALSHLQSLPTLPSVVSSNNTSAEIAVHPNNRFVYCSIRGQDSIAVFSRDVSTGLILPLEIVPSGGTHPRHFALSPDGEWLICANRDSNNLTSFRVNSSTGRLTACGKQTGIPKPTCVLFMPRS